MQISIISIQCVGSVLDFEFNLKTLQYFTNLHGYVTAGRGHKSDHLAKKSWTVHKELSGMGTWKCLVHPRHPLAGLAHDLPNCPFIGSLLFDCHPNRIVCMQLSAIDLNQFFS